MSVLVDDFTWVEEDALFVHNPTGFMLDGDFVFLFEKEMIAKVFFGSTAMDIPEKTIDDLKAIMQEYEESKV